MLFQNPGKKLEKIVEGSIFERYAIRTHYIQVRGKLYGFNSILCKSALPRRRYSID